MTIDRRKFLKTSSVATLMITSASVVQTNLKHAFSSDNNTKKYQQSQNEKVENNPRKVASVLSRRFPKLDFSDDLIHSLTESLAKDTSNSLNNKHITKEEYIIREFVLNSNYTLCLLDKTQVLKFIPYGSLPAMT